MPNFQPSIDAKKTSYREVNTTELDTKLCLTRKKKLISLGPILLIYKRTAGLLEALTFLAIKNKMGIFGLFSNWSNEILGISPRMDRGGFQFSNRNLEL